jgi:hypothetical protein
MPLPTKPIDPQLLLDYINRGLKAQRAVDDELARTIGQRWLVLHDGRAIKCLVCGWVSWHPTDVEQRYCGHCHRFLEDG